MDGRLYAFDATTGQEKWVNKTQDGITSSAVVVNDIVYAGSDDRHVYAFDAYNGATKWMADIGGNQDQYLYSSPAVANGWVYVSARDQKIHAFSLPGSTP